MPGKPLLSLSFDRGLGQKMPKQGFLFCNRQSVIFCSDILKSFLSKGFS